MTSLWDYIHEPLDGASQLFANEKERADAYASLFRLDVGRKVLKDLLNACGMFEAMLPNTPEIMGFNAGKQAVCVHILGMVNKKDFYAGSGTDGSGE